VAWLAHNERRYGPYVHGDRFTAVLWGPGRGMEYDGATTAAVGALEHEVFHSWFGRGVKPMRASDGWIDEAWTSWATNSRRREIPRFHVEELTLDEPPVTLYPPDEWSRHTPVEAYKEGSRLFAGIAHALGGAPQMREAMAQWYQANAGGFVTTDDLERHLSERSQAVPALFRRYVHGQAGT
jgi:aminopeptidase N